MALIAICRGLARGKTLFRRPNDRGESRFGFSLKSDHEIWENHMDQQMRGR